MFQTVPLSIIRSFSLYTQQCYMSYTFADSLRTLRATCQQTCMTYTIAVCTVKISASSWFYYKNSTTIFNCHRSSQTIYIYTHICVYMCVCVYIYIKGHYILEGYMPV